MIRLQPDGDGGHRRLPPLPWVNVIANEQAGFLVTESGAGYTWCGQQSIIGSRPGTTIRFPIRTAKRFGFATKIEHVFWSPTPGPNARAGEYRVRHGFGYTTFKHESHELSQEVTMFMARDEPVKITRLRLANRSGRTRRLSLFSYLHWALGGSAAETAGTIATDLTTSCGPFGRPIPAASTYGDCVAFSAIAVGRVPRMANCAIPAIAPRFWAATATLDAPAAVVDSRASWIDRTRTCRRSVRGLAGADRACRPAAHSSAPFLLAKRRSRLRPPSSIDKYRTPNRSQQALDEVARVLARHAVGHHDRNAGSRNRSDGQRLADSTRT